ncbi:MAG: tetratricopeptide repeat protein [Deltaproteobacteria bacterium]|nr:tetratricopeptide repeat protein [Deltaproteobacteria bacterium]
MARAQAHLAAGRFAEATGAFRAALGIAPHHREAQVGLADSLTARGLRAEAVTSLVDAAQSLAARDAHLDALTLYGKALAIDPQRSDLHLDVAFVEWAMGQRETAIGRIEGLADRYMSTGRTDEAAELLRFAATWGDDVAEPSPAPTPMPAAVPTKPVAASATPVVVPAKPIAVPAKPIAVRAKPIAVSTRPTVVRAKPAVVSTKPIAVPTKPAERTDVDDTDIDDVVTIKPVPVRPRPMAAHHPAPIAPRPKRAGTPPAPRQPRQPRQPMTSNETVVRATVLVRPDGRPLLDDAGTPVPVERATSTKPLRLRRPVRATPQPDADMVTNVAAAPRPPAVVIGRSAPPRPPAPRTPSSVRRGAPPPPLPPGLKSRRASTPPPPPPAPPRSSGSNPLAARLRRRAGLGTARGGSPPPVPKRPTAPIAVARTDDDVTVLYRRPEAPDAQMV